jgi:hypothetical protein
MCSAYFVFDLISFSGRAERASNLPGLGPVAKWPFGMHTTVAILLLVFTAYN